MVVLLIIIHLLYKLFLFNHMLYDLILSPQISYIKLKQRHQNKSSNLSQKLQRFIYIY
jgi:hypothetical protein